MDIATLEQRIKDLAGSLEQSVANHNALVGRIEEAKHILDGLKKVAEVAEVVVEAL